MALPAGDLTYSWQDWSHINLALRLRFHNHAPQQLARGLTFHQQAADELGGDLLGGATEEGVREGPGKGGGYGSGLGMGRDYWEEWPESTKNPYPEIQSSESKTLTETRTRLRANE